MLTFHTDHHNMMDPAAFVHSRIASIKALRKIREKMNPGSGISVAVKLGVLSDACEDEADRPRREWVAVELGDNMEAIMALLIQEQINSLKRWQRNCETYRIKLDAAAAAAKEFF